MILDYRKKIRVTFSNLLFFVAFSPINTLIKASQKRKQYYLCVCLCRAKLLDVLYVFPHSPHSYSCFDSLLLLRFRPKGVIISCFYESDIQVGNINVKILKKKSTQHIQPLLHIAQYTLKSRILVKVQFLGNRNYGRPQRITHSAILLLY